MYVEWSTWWVSMTPLIVIGHDCSFFLQTIVDWTTQGLSISTQLYHQHWGGPGLPRGSPPTHSCITIIDGCEEGLDHSGALRQHTVALPSLMGVRRDWTAQGLSISTQLHHRHWWVRVGPGPLRASPSAHSCITIIDGCEEGLDRSGPLHQHTIASPSLMGVRRAWTAQCLSIITQLHHHHWWVWGGTGPLRASPSAHSCITIIDGCEKGQQLVSYTVHTIVVTVLFKYSVTCTPPISMKWVNHQGYHARRKSRLTVP